MQLNMSTAASNNLQSQSTNPPILREQTSKVDGLDQGQLSQMMDSIKLSKDSKLSQL
jgi:hypothetical protein